MELVSTPVPIAFLQRLLNLTVKQGLNLQQFAKDENVDEEAAMFQNHEPNQNSSYLQYVPFTPSYTPKFLFGHHSISHLTASND